MYRAIVVSIMAFISTAVTDIAIAESNYLGGNFSNITSAGVGLMIMLDSGIPTNCAGTPYNWILIKEENKTMIALAMTMWAKKETCATVYTAPVGGSGYCTVTQLDPC